MLRYGFTQVWSRLAGENEALIEEFAGATLELSRVNAGPACIEAFWQAALAVGPDRLRLISAGGRAAADICRFAGAGAALACLEALPTAIRMTAGDPANLGFVWRGLNRLSREAPAVVRGTARRMETVLGSGDGMAFADFIAAGLKATAKDPVRRIAFFTLDDPLSQVLLARQNSPHGFADAERMLSGFVSGLWGVEPRLKPGPSQRRTVIASGVVLLPPVLAASATRTLAIAVSCRCGPRPRSSHDPHRATSHCYAQAPAGRIGRSGGGRSGGGSGDSPISGIAPSVGRLS